MTMPYTLTLHNKSSMPWMFYIYPTLPEQHHATVSLVWYVTPFNVASGAEVSLNWTIEYGFVWQAHEVLSGGVKFSAEGQMPGDLKEHNTVTFSELHHTPVFSKPVAGSPTGSMVIHSDTSVQEKGFVVGISIDGRDAFLTPTGPNLTASFKLENNAPKYWIAACDEIELGAVVDIAANINSFEVVFPDGVYEQAYSLDTHNVWAATTHPPSCFKT